MRTFFSSVYYTFMLFHYYDVKPYIERMKEDYWTKLDSTDIQFSFLNYSQKNVLH